MSKYDTIIGYINTGLTSGNFASNRFQRGKFYGITELLKLEEGTMPCVIADNGQATKISIDDNYPFQLYHRILGIEGEEDEAGYGQDIDVIERCSMQMVIIFNREIIRLKKEDIVSGVFSSLITGISKANMASLNINECNISYGNFNLNYEDVYNAEYNLGEYLLKPQTVMVALPYEIEVKYRKGCIQICN
jgi:hypothetical protein